MSVFDRLTNTASSTPATSVYNRLVGTKATTTRQGSVYDRLTKPAVKEPVKAVLPPAKEPFNSTGLGIATNTILGIPEAAYKSAKFVSDKLTKAGVNFYNDLTKLRTSKGRNEIAYNAAKALEPLTTPEGAILNLTNPTGISPAKLASGLGIPEGIMKLISGSKDAKIIAGALKEAGIAEKEIPTLAEKLATVSDQKQIASEIANTLKQQRAQITPTTEKVLSQAETVPQKSTQQIGGEVPAISQKPITKGAVSQIESKSLPNTITELPQKSSGDVNKYLEEQVAKQVAARNEGGITGLKNKTVDLYKEAKKKLVDFAAPIEDVLRTSTKKAKMSILPTGDITNQIDRVLKTPTMAGQFAREHGLDQVIKEAENLDHLDQYMIAKQSIAVDTRGINTGRDFAKDTSLVKALAPQYEGLAQKVTQYSRNLLNYAVDSGLVSRETADMLFKRYPDYVPLNRIFSETEKGNQIFGSKAIANLGKQTVVQSLKGSDRVVESPIRSILGRTIDAFKQGERNKAAKLLASYEKIPGNPFQLRELKKGEVSTGKNTITFFDKGVKRTFETTKEIADAARNLNSQQLNVLLQAVFGVPTRVLKVGTTGINAPFIGANVTRDQVTALINSNNALKTSVANPVLFLSSLYKAAKGAVKHGELFDEMVRNGALGTSFDISRNEVVPTIERIRAGKSIKSKIKYTVRHPGELLRAVENILGRSEELTRMQQYNGAKRVALKEGWSEADAQIIASRAARENTVNFARRGEWGQIINAMIPYAGAGIQGSRTFVRSMKERPLATATKLAVLVFTPVAVSTAWNLSDPKRKEAYDDIVEYEKQNNIIIVPPNPTKNADGTWNVFKMPLSQEVNNVASMIRRPLEQMHGLDPVGVGEIAKAFIGSVEPIEPTSRGIASAIIPQTVKPFAESVYNKNFFTGLPIVPESMIGQSPELQYKPYTSGTARLFGKATGMSPLKVEAFIKGTVGGVGSQAINVIDNVMATGGVIPKDQIGGQNVIKAIGARFSSARGGQSEQLGENLAKAVTAQKDQRFLNHENAEIAWTALNSLPKEQAKIKFDELIKNNPLMAKEISSIAKDEQMGLGWDDRVVKTLQVENGARAKFIVAELNDKKTLEEKKTLWNEYLTKKIITAQVAQQITSLLKK